MGRESSSHHWDEKAASSVGDIGPWHIAIVPTDDESVVEIKGLLFAKDFPITLGSHSVLKIRDTEYKGREIEGKTPVFSPAGTLKV